MTITRIQYRRGTAAAWTDADPVLADSERGFQLPDVSYPNGRWKTGKSGLNWSALPYDDDPEVAFPTSTAEGRAVLTGDAAAGRTALELDMAAGVGDGAADDRTAIAALDTAAVAAGLPIRFKKGTYRFGSAITIASHVIMNPGAILKPDSGVTITITGGMTAAIRQVFDLSAGGKVRVKNPVVYPDWWGAVGDGTTDDATPLRTVFIDNIVAFGGGTIEIPFGKVYASSLPIDMKNNTRVVGSGGLKCLAFHSAGMFIQYKNAVKNVTWDGPFIDINYAENMNAHAIGDVPNTTDFCSDIYIRGKVFRTRIMTGADGESGNDIVGGGLPVLYAGGGKALTVQFRARNVYCNITTEDCDIAASFEAAVSDTRHLENVVVDLQAKDSKRCAIFIGGSREGISSLDSGSFMHAKYPGVIIRARVWGGNDGLITDPVNTTQEVPVVDDPNYLNAGVLTMNYASGVSVELDVATPNRCTLVRGMCAASTIKITNAHMDELQDLWDTRPIDTLEPAGAFMADNVFEANVHAKTHHGVLVRPHRNPADTAQKTMIKTLIDLNVWCQDGVGAITQDDGTTDEFGVSVNYRFRDMKSSPIREVAGVSGHDPKPAWSDAVAGGKTWLGNLAANNHVSARASTVASASAVVMTLASAQVQVVTGTESQTVRLPTTGVVAGQSYTFINQNTAQSVIVQSTNTNVVGLVNPGRNAVFTALADTPVANTDWQITFLNGSVSATANTVALRDTSGNVTAIGFIGTSTSTATAAGSTALTVASSQTRVFTGSTTQTCVLPTTSIVAGQWYTVINQSSGVVTVNSSGGNLVHSLAAGEGRDFKALAATPTTAAHWRVI